ncbi:MAG: DUF559 domain-containing protein [Novosphingobium sp.]
MVEKRMTPVARKLRAEPTDAAIRLWSRLRGKQLGVQFTREFPIGRHVVDFACRRAKLVVEADGGQHADNVDDEARTRLIEAHGYTVIRFWNNDILSNTDGVIQMIVEALDIARNRY